MSYLNELMKQGAERHRAAAKALEEVRNDNARTSARNDAVSLIGDPSVSDKSDVYLAARLNAKADSIEKEVGVPAPKFDGKGHQYREDDAPPSGPYGLGGYSHLGRGDADHRGDAARAEAAFQRSVENLNASRRDGEGTTTITAEEKRAHAIKSEATDAVAEGDTSAAEAAAEAAWKRANERLNDSRTDRHHPGVLPGMNEATAGSEEDAYARSVANLNRSRS